MKYWQHEAPLSCPRGHAMGCLGLVYWMCDKCRTIYCEAHDGQ